MSTGAIIGIVVGCLAVVGLIVGLVFYFKNKKQNSNGGDVTLPENVIQLKSVLRGKGSGDYGLETDTEVSKRLQSLSREEFVHADLYQYPWTEEQFNEVDKSTAEARRVYEQKILFAYNPDKSLNPSKAVLLRREF